MNDSPLVIALDGEPGKEGAYGKALAIALAAKDSAWGFKISNLLDDDPGRSITDFRRHGRVFADTKYHDIPGTVWKRIRSILRWKPTIVTVHAAGGFEMLAAAAAAVEGTETEIFAITVLTSLSPEEVWEIRGRSLETTALGDARRAFRAGIRGVVCSAWELHLLRNDPELRALRIAVPGIRAEGEECNDQARTASARAAIEAGADLLIVGRPITGATNPGEAAKNLAAELRALC